jgi:delta14-sterol reductase
MDISGYGTSLLIELSLLCGIVAMHMMIPGESITGYCCDSAMKPLKYKLNGLIIMIVTPILFMMTAKEIQVSLYDNYSTCLVGANGVGFLLSFALIIRGGHEKYYRSFTVDQMGQDISKMPLGNKYVSLMQRFYLGCEWNPRFLNIDSKMMLYIYGAVRLELNILSCCAWQYYHTGTLSNGMIIYTLMFLWFLHEYMYFENVHLYTYDLFAEKVGFKLTWGCVVFYPFFYCIGMFSIVQSGDADLSFVTCTAIGVLFISGWICTRGANLQKYVFRTQPKHKTYKFLGVLSFGQKTVKDTRILCSGFWGVARHFNYFGEIVQGFALALPGAILAPTPYYMILPFLYPLFYVTLFVTRQIDDDALCLKKYGQKWTEYCKIVPWKICPGIW